MKRFDELNGPFPAEYSKAVLASDNLTPSEDFLLTKHTLSSLAEEVAVDPAEDLVCLCANCHRMMHRTRADVMTVEELKRIFRP